MEDQFLLSIGDLIKEARQMSRQNIRSIMRKTCLEIIERIQEEVLFAIEQDKDTEQTFQEISRVISEYFGTGDYAFDSSEFRKLFLLYCQDPIRQTLFDELDPESLQVLDALIKLLEKTEFSELAKDSYHDLLSFSGPRGRFTEPKTVLKWRLLESLKTVFLESRSGFCLIGRPQRWMDETKHSADRTCIRDDDHTSFVDLVFYNRMLCCLVIAGVKTGQLTEEDFEKMQKSMEAFDSYEKFPEENNTFGLLIGVDQKDLDLKIIRPKDCPAEMESQLEQLLPDSRDLKKLLERHLDIRIDTFILR